MVDVHRIIAKVPPQRTGKGHSNPSDLVNILFLGSGESISRAFHAAGWSGAQGTSIRSRMVKKSVLIENTRDLESPDSGR
jgi:LssY C-terminus